MIADTTDAGLREKLRQYIALYKIYQNDDEFTDVILSLINSHTDTLLERVLDEVIGENEDTSIKAEQSDLDRKLHGNTASDLIKGLWAIRAATRNVYRAEQLTALATIKGEKISDE